jgi:protein-disulfide isomerase
MLLVGALAFLALGGGALFVLMLLSQREHPRERPAPRNARPVVEVAPRVEPAVPTPAPVALEAPAAIPVETGLAPEHGSLPGRWGLTRAPVAIVVWNDFQCPYCRRLDQSLMALHDRYPTQVEVYHRDLPLAFHPEARGAAIAARCAGEQGAYWPMHDLLFANPASLGVEGLLSWANALDLSVLTFDTCRDSPAAARAVDEDVAAAQALGVRGTPTTFVNGRRLDGAQPVDQFVEAIEAELASGRAY